MNRALELASMGRGNVSPNPMVGAVIVANGKIIGEGYHQQVGKSHAEVNAFAQVNDKEALKSATIYVTLEPCNHYGRTPPCTLAILEAGIPKVVIASVDSNPQVSGSGIQRLKEAGVELITGILDVENRELNRRFYTFHEQKRPYVILKWAQTADGFIARKDYSSKWISDVYSRQLVHLWRSEEDAILVGRQTALVDNPSLTVRDVSGRNPIRVLLDTNLEIPKTHAVFNNEAETLCLNTQKNGQEGNLEYIKFTNTHEIHEVMKALFQRNIQSLIVEGGAATLQWFIDEGIWDEARVFTAEKVFGKGIKAPVLKGAGKVIREKVMEDELAVFRR